MTDQLVAIQALICFDLCPFRGQRRVEASDQPLAGVVGVSDLGQVELVE